MWLKEFITVQETTKHKQIYQHTYYQMANMQQVADDVSRFISVQPQNKKQNKRILHKAPSLKM